MTEAKTPKRWLQHELRRRLLLPVLALVVLGGVLGVLGTERLVEKVFDRWLLDAGRSLAREVRFEQGQAQIRLVPQAESLLSYDLLDAIYYEVRQDGRHLYGNEALPLEGTQERRYRTGARAYNASYAGRPVRVAWISVAGPDGRQAEVLMAETLVKRGRTHRELLWWFSPVCLLMVAATLVIVTALRRTLRPLEGMAARWNARSHASLEPLPTQDVPREILPFATALNALLARVRAVLERERQFAATAAHQLRTPLAGLQLGLDRAAAAPDLAGAREVISGLGASTARMARLIQQLLALSRLDPEVGSGLDFDSLDLAELARVVGEAYLDAAAARDIELELQVPEPGPVPVRGQRELLGEALGNLIDNAIRYTPPSGQVLISVQAYPPAITVADSGPGIAPAYREQLFQRFARPGEQASEGSGLGLAIAREIAQLHGAELLLQASPLGGAQFTLRFAAALPEEPVAAAALLS